MQVFTPQNISYVKTSDSAISSITKGPRQSNFELLRIVAMCLVLIVHADFISLGLPTAADYANAPMASFGRDFFQALAIIGVNIFVLISGWFSIKPTFKGACNFLFQCSFIILSIYFIAKIVGWYDSSTIDWIRIGIFFRGYWFIQAYLILFILAPILNCFSANASKQSMIIVLFCFFTIQSASTTMLDIFRFFQGGYSPLSFIGLYLLAQLIRLHFPNYRTCTAYILFFSGLIINTLYFFVIHFFQLLNPFDTFAYSNPLVILQSVGLLLIFSRISIKQNKIINWIAASSFAVYLVHIHPAIFGFFKSTVSGIYNRYDSIECLAAIFVFLCIVFAVSVLYDQPRKLIWKFLQQRLFPSPQK